MKDRPMKAQLLTHLTRLEARRPLDLIGDAQARLGAGKLREWFRGSFLVEER